MIDVLVDGVNVEKELKAEETVAELISSIASDLDDGRSIVHVNLDGRDVTGRFELQQQSVDDYAKLEISTGGTIQVALDVLGGLIEFHQALVSEFSNAANEFRLGEQEKSNQLFARGLDGLQILLKTTLSSTHLLKVDPKTIVVNDITLEKATEMVNSLLDEIIEAQTQRDLILLADLIEYELNPLIEDWKGYLLTLQAKGTGDEESKG